MTLTSIEWHEEPLAMQGEFNFNLRRPGVRGASQGCLTVFNEAGRMHLMNVLAAMRWPLPEPFANVVGRSQIGTVCLTRDEIASLDVGDFVWVADAEISPLGLRVQFQPSDGQLNCAAWIKRSLMERDTLSAVLVQASGQPSDITLSVISPAMAVARSWLTGTQPAQRLPQSALTMGWTACRGSEVIFQGQLLVVGRRLGLRITHINHTAPSAIPQIKQVI
jgi:hypothetical protein